MGEGEGDRSGEWGVLPTAAQVVARRRRRRRRIAGSGAAGVLVLVAGGLGVQAVLRVDDGPRCAEGDEVAVVVLLDPNVGPGEERHIEDLLEERDGVDHLDHVDRDEAHAEAQEMFLDEAGGREVLRAEDVPPRFEVIASDLAAGRSLQGALDASPGVATVSILVPMGARPDGDDLIVVRPAGRGASCPAGFVDGGS